MVLGLLRLGLQRSYAKNCALTMIFIVHVPFKFVSVAGKVIYIPSSHTYQFHLFSYTGMVCWDVASRINNPDIGLYLRPSMNKFDSKNKSIDIVRVSSMPSASFLNRQIILLLSSLGINDEIFFQMQEEMLTHLSAITVDHQKAREFLNNFGGSSGNGYHAFLLAYLKRFGKQIDPFVRQILMAFQAFLVKELRTKARILVPHTWSLFGVADETRTLKYGEVFIQIEQKNTSGDIVSKIITGSVVVTRNPCFHPGDIRRLNAVDIPALRQLKNVIVFPIHGLRSHPAEMSGGDLDGDTFWVSHEQRFLFNENEEPFDYHDQATEDAQRMELETGTDYTINDVCNFFVEYIEADK
jgi:RNA-dependent RNA polymerase